MKKHALTWQALLDSKYFWAICYSIIYCVTDHWQLSITRSRRSVMNFKISVLNCLRSVIANENWAKNVQRETNSTPIFAQLLLNILCPMQPIFSFSQISSVAITCGQGLNSWQQNPTSTVMEQFDFATSVRMHIGSDYSFCIASEQKCLKRLGQWPLFFLE